MNAVNIRPAFLSPSLEIFATDETGVDVDIRQRDRAQFFEIKVEGYSINL